jgi:hypothetical protein
VLKLDLDRDKTESLGSFSLKTETNEKYKPSTKLEITNVVIDFPLFMKIRHYEIII